MMRRNFTRLLKIAMFFLIFFSSVAAGGNECSEKRCSGPKSPAIRFPFRLRGVQPQHCRYSQSFDLSCNEDNTTILELPNSVKLLVTKIDYKSQTIHLSDPANCLMRVVQNLNFSASPFRYPSEEISNYTVFKCNSSPTNFFFRFPSCLGSSARGLYVVRPWALLDRMLSCTKMYELVSIPFGVFDEEAKLLLEWSKPNCSRCESRGGRCELKNLNNTKRVSEYCNYGAPEYEAVKKKLRISAAVIGPVFVALVLFALYSMYRKHKIYQENEAKIETFLADYEALKPARYSYADIKRITNQFSDEIGQGAYGTVYKGKLSNEILVAVKVLNNAKPNGEEFINEVGIISGIHHVNVVRMVGFCAEGFRRALVYEFLPNGSLQDLIKSCDRSSSNFVGWKKMRDIATGIAKGIKYLHQGCEQRIVHFDIKPHNVLLDHDFNPKVSDFGTAKLCSRDQSKVSMTTARGTVGYIAPEVFSRNGGASYKSDVFSFGMLLLEMVGKNKNSVDNDTSPENNQFYLPEWIYERLEQGNDLEVGIEEEDDVKIVKSLAIVGLWCIQWQPVDRPSMSVVVKMIEGNEELKMPNNPFVKSPMLRKSNVQLELLSVISESE